MNILVQKIGDNKIQNRKKLNYLNFLLDNSTCLINKLTYLWKIAELIPCRVLCFRNSEIFIFNVHLEGGNAYQLKRGNK